jgi:hypothetical protein
MRRITSVFALVVVAACTHAPPPSMVWVRTDGQRIADNPTLAPQGENDKAICEGDAQGAPSSTPADLPADQEQSTATMQSMRDCMLQKGYVLAPADQAEAVRERYAASPAQLRPSVPVTQPPHTAVKPRPKPRPKPHPPQQSPQPQPQPSQTEQQQPSQAQPWPSPESPQQAPAWPSPE